MFSPSLKSPSSELRISLYLQKKSPSFEGKISFMPVWNISDSGKDKVGYLMIIKV